MPEGQNVYRGFVRLVAVKGDISGIPDSDHQLTQFVGFGKWPADIGDCLQQKKLPFDGQTYASGSFRRPCGQKLPASRQARDRALGDNYSWHSGTGFSSAVPQTLSQSRASSPVR